MKAELENDFGEETDLNKHRGNYNKNSCLIEIKKT